MNTDWKNVRPSVGLLSAIAVLAFSVACSSPSNELPPPDIDAAADAVVSVDASEVEPRVYPLLLAQTFQSELSSNGIFFRHLPFPPDFEGPPRSCGMEIVLEVGECIVETPTGSIPCPTCDDGEVCVADSTCTAVCVPACPQCTDDEFCPINYRECLPNSMREMFGDEVTVSGIETVRVLQPPYTMAGFESFVFNDQRVSATSSGATSVGYGPFTVEADPPVFPDTLGMLSTLTLDSFSADLPLTWTAGDDIRIQIRPQSDPQLITCNPPDTGAYTIPQAAFSLFPFNLTGVRVGFTRRTQGPPVDLEPIGDFDGRAPPRAQVAIGFRHSEIFDVARPP